jgi:hypothetical protein
MGLAVTSPLSIPQLLDRSFQLFKRALPKVLPLTIAASVLSGLPALLFPPQHMGAKVNVNYPGKFFLLYLVVLAISASISIALIRKVNDIAEERNSLTLADSYLGGLKLLPPFIGGMILYMIAMMGGMILLVIPGLILMVSMSFFWLFIVLENQGALASLRSSRNLIRGHWWRWATIATVAFAVLAALYVALGFISVAVMRATVAGNATTGLLLANFIAQVLVSSISLPLLYSVQIIGFRDLQLRKSGSDLATRIAQAT